MELSLDDQEVKLVTSPEARCWDCRWPDPVALKVATDRILSSRPLDDPGLNRILGVFVRMEPPNDAGGPVSAILVTPWAVERIYWHHYQPNTTPPITHAAKLELDGAGRVAAGQGVLFQTKERTLPVIIGWEPETGHYFIETLLHQVYDYRSANDAINAALGVRPISLGKKSLDDRLNDKVSRRGILGLSSLFKRPRNS